MLHLDVISYDFMNYQEKEARKLFSRDQLLPMKIFK